MLNIRSKLVLKIKKWPQRRQVPRHDKHGVAPDDFETVEPQTVERLFGQMRQQRGRAMAGRKTCGNDIDGHLMC